MTLTLNFFILYLFWFLFSAFYRLLRFRLHLFLLPLFCGVKASGLIYSVDPSLVKVDYEYDIVSEAGDSVHGWHRDDEREQIVDDRVQESVEKHVLG